MPTRHVIHQIEAYLDRQLSPEVQAAVEEHVVICPTCARYLLEARRVATELGPMMQTTLGRPHPLPGLRHKIRQEVYDNKRSGRLSFPWLLSGRLLNTVGTLAVIALLAWGAFLVIQGQMAGGDPPAELGPVGSNEGDGPENPTVLLTPAPPVITTSRPTAMPVTPVSAGDTLPQPTPAAGGTAEAGESFSPSDQESNLESLSQSAGIGGQSPDSNPLLPPLEGTIAFSLFDPAPGRQVYEIHLIEADGANHRLFPLDGVSEPALLWTENGYRLAFRAWSQPTSPRSLLSSNLAGETPVRIGGFFEDAQPDWSPTEYRLIFASQRESDRRWRLYTSWGDGSAQRELRREGKSPSFGPEGYQFVFEGCDKSGNRCGLWLGNLTDSEYGSTPLLTDPLAKSPDWSPRGDRIVYMAAPDDNWDLYTIESDGRGQPRRLTFNTAIDGLPVWSPDGAWLAFLSDRSGAWGIWLLHVDSSHLRQIFEFDGGTYTPPAGEPYNQRNWWDEQLSWSR
jgi:TolB protein